MNRLDIHTHPGRPDRLVLNDAPVECLDYRISVIVGGRVAVTLEIEAEIRSYGETGTIIEAEWFEGERHGQQRGLLGQTIHQAGPDRGVAATGPGG